MNETNATGGVEVIQKIEQLIENAGLLKPISLPGDTSRTARFYARSAGKTTELLTFTIPESPRHYQVRTVLDLCAMLVHVHRIEAKSLPAENGPDAGKEVVRQAIDQPKQLITISRGGVTGFIDEIADRRQRIGMTLTPSVGITMLENIAAKAKAGKLGETYQKHPEFMRNLRIFFDFASKADYARLKLLKFGGEASQTSDTGRTHDSLGKSVAMKAMAGDGGEIPEVITLEFPIWEEIADLKATIKCSVEVNLGDSTITMVPLPGEIEHEWLTAFSEIASQVQATLQNSELANTRIIRGALAAPIA